MSQSLHDLQRKLAVDPEDDAVAAELARAHIKRDDSVRACAILC